MISVEEASALVKRHLNGWGECSAGLAQYGSHVCAEDLLADREYPPINRATMDGIALNFDEYQNGRREFRISGIIAAGDAQKSLSNPSECFEIMTGASVPAGADLVIQCEHTEVKNGFVKVIKEIPRTRFESVHLKGSDCAAGQVVLKAGQIMHGPHWGIAVSMGYHSVKVKKNPTVMVISTGDELVEVSEQPLPHQLRRSNAHALKAALLAAGYADVVLDHLRDDAAAVAEHYQKNAPHFDLMIYSGGVSKGKFDYLPAVWADMGVTRYFQEVSQRPGKPLWFGADETRKTTVFGLPGNPVSALVCLHRYVIPSEPMFVKLTEEFLFAKDLTYFLPVRLTYNADATVSATPLKYQNSGEFTALAGSHGFIELPKQKSTFAVGEVFPFYAWKV